MAEHSHISLYRKYRPQSFDDVVAQDHIVSLLSESIKKGTFPHAYLFSGSRGLGKTSVARIFAREIGTTPADTHEIDAASTRGIDDIRALKEEVNVLPFESKYKVYIIDEVHMLTREAFNALLKTLEEPPLHVIFILATTEFHKVPATIISRCEVHSFRKPSVIILENLLTEIAEKEGKKLEPEAAHALALIAEGSYRDAIGNLQKALDVGKGKNISREEIERVFSLPPRSLILSILEGVGEGDREKILSSIERAEEGNIDFELLYRLLLEDLRSVLLMRYVPSERERLEDLHTRESFNVIEKVSSEGVKTVNSRTLSRLLGAGRDIRTSVFPRLALELALLDSIEE